jgi:hypothetical protein
LQEAEGTGDVAERVRAWRDLAHRVEILVEKQERAAGVTNRAPQEAEGIEDAEYKAITVPRGAQALAQAGGVDELNLALRAEEGIEDAGTRAEWPRWLAQSLVQAGKQELAAEAADRAVQATEGIEDEGSRARVLSEVAQVLAQVGKQELAADVASHALQEAEGIEDQGSRARVLSALAQALAQAGKQKQAAGVAVCVLRMAEGIEDAESRADALRAAAQALAQAGKVDGLDRALQSIKEIGDKWHSIRTLTDVAQDLTQVGQVTQALYVLRTAFRYARLAGREAVFGALHGGAPALAAIDQGQTLWRIYEAVLEIDGWWDVA